MQRLYNLEQLEAQLSSHLGKKYRYWNLINQIDQPTYDQKFDLAEQVLQEPDLSVFNAQAEYQQWRQYN